MNTNDQSRRDFLTKVAALSVAGLVGGGNLDSVFDGADSAAPPPSRGLRPEDFTRHIGQTFVIQDQERRIDAVLVEVTQSRRSTATRPSFSVMFRTDHVEAVPHQIYALEHPTMGQVEIFLGAVGRPVSQQHLEAVFG